MAPKPGVIALRPLGVGEILDGSFSVMRMNPAATLGITLGTAAIMQTINTVMLIAADEASTTAAYMINVVTLLLTGLLLISLSGVLSIVVSEATLGQKISVGDAVRRIAPRLPGLIGLSLVVLLLIILGAATLVIGAFYIAVVLALATPAFVLEGGTFRHAMRRSFDLVQGAWWRTFGILLLAGLIALLLIFIFSIPAAVVISTSRDTFGDVAAGDLTTAGYIVRALSNLLATTISAPILSGAIVLAYVDRRIRREGLDVTLAEAARQRAGRLTL
jgi:hypothetical protein